MGKQNKFNSREADERAEGEQMLDSNVPGTKFQQEQQVQKPVESGMKASTDSNSFNPKQSGNKGSQLKQESVAKVITGTGGGSPAESVASPSRSGLRTLAYSGNEGTILGSASGTPFVGSPSRSDTRPGQKLDAVAKAIDFIASETVLQDYDGSKPLEQNPSEVQGFLGHPENQYARSQKVAESVPGALLYQRSVDENIRDEIVFAEGQMIKEKNIEYHVDPKYTYEPETKKYKSYDNPRGNYIPKTMHLGVDGNGQIVRMSFDVDDVTVEGDYSVLNDSSSAYIRAMNKDELNRQTMESKAGIETESNWCPLVRADKEPTPIIGSLTDDEIIVGSELFMGYRFLNKAHAQFFNKASKDGQVPFRSFKEMLKGAAVSHRTSTEYDDDSIPFNVYDYANGAPSLMIALFDSIAKYSKRGDLLTQPRSWRMHKQTADNNINVFKVHPDMAKYVINKDTFSTVDRPYDPLLPVNITDTWRVCHVRNFNKLLNKAKSTTFVLKLGGKGLTTAGDAFNTIYSDLSGKESSTNIVRLAYYKNASAQNGNIYDYFNYENSMRYDQDGVLVDFCIANTTGMVGYDTYLEGYEAATKKLNDIDHNGSNKHLHPIVIMFKIKDTVDKVYALIRYPGIFNVTVTPNVQLFIKHETTVDYMSSDTSVDTTIVSTTVLDCDLLVYEYQNRQNHYTTTVKNPLLYGIYEWAANLGPKLANPQHTGSGDNMPYDGQGIRWYHIPIIHSTLNISLWDLIVCSAVPFMQKIRTNSQFDTLNYEENNGEYPYTQLVSISEANPLATVNYGMSDLLHPLVVQQMKPATAISWIVPEKFWRIAHEDVNGSGIYASETFVLPYYFNEEQFDFTIVNGAVHMKYNDEGHVMSYPSTRSGIRSALLDSFYSMTERDIRLCLDRMTRIPGNLNGTNDVIGVGVYKYGLSNSGVPVVKYDYRNPLNIMAYLTTPRELGLGMVAPAGYNTPAVNKSYTNSHVSFKDYATLSTLISVGTSYRIKTWKVNGKDYSSFLNGNTLAVDRAMNFAQAWAVRGDLVYAPTDGVEVESYGYLNAAPNIGIALNFNDVMEISSGVISGEAGKSKFKPFTDGLNGTSHNSGLPYILTLQNALWPRLQCLPYALSPFDQTPEAREYAGSYVTYDMTADPYDLLYILGFCGFKASDYREDIFNRIYAKQTLGWTFISDPFVEASPVLK